MSETPEVFDSKPADCPKCGGESIIDRFVQGNPVRDVNGEFSVRIISPDPQEHLVVHCRTRGYERLMNVWNES